VRFRVCVEAGGLAGSCGGACAAATADKASSKTPATEFMTEAFMTSSPRRIDSACGIRAETLPHSSKSISFHRHGKQRLRVGMVPNATANGEQ
jgi:hypothetical protein